MTGCSAYGCSNRSDQGYSLKSFPKDPIRRAVWIMAVRRKDWLPTRYSRLCEVHFESDQFEKPDVEGKVKLKHNAIPTIFNYNKNQEKKSKSLNIV